MRFPRSSPPLAALSLVLLAGCGSSNPDAVPETSVADASAVAHALPVVMSRSRQGSHDSSQQCVSDCTSGLVSTQSAGLGAQKTCRPAA